MVRSALFLVLSLLALAGSACGGASDAPAVADVSGAWSVSLTTGQNSCGLPTGAEETFSITVAQRPGDPHFTVSGGILDAAPGDLEGSTLTLTASADTASCAPETFELTATLDAAGDGASGTAAWTCAAQGQTCSGSSTFTMTRP